MEMLMKLIENSSHRKPFSNIEVVLPPGALVQKQSGTESSNQLKPTLLK